MAAAPSLSSFLISSSKRLVRDLVSGIVHGETNVALPPASAVVKLGGVKPLVSQTARIHEDAVVTGRVMVYDGVKIEQNAVVRGETNSIVIGANSIIRSKAVLQAISPDQHSKVTGLPNLLRIGENVLVGNAAVLESCVVEDDVKIGPNVVVGESAVVEKGSVLASGTVIPPGRRVPAGTKWGGNPAKFLGMVDDH